MKVTIFSQFFPPEMEPTGFMINSLVKYLSNKNYKVDVICGFPNFPSGKFLDRNFLSFFRKRKINNYFIKNVYVVPSDNKNNIKRIINYLSYMFTSFVVGCFSERKDIYIASSPPIFVALSCLLVSKIKNGKFILDVRDIWPESAIQMGSIKNKFIINIFTILEKLLYKHAEEIIVATPGMVSIVRNKCSSEKKITYIPCGITVPQDLPSKIHHPLINKDNKLNLLYAGLHGHAQNLVTLCELAYKLQDYTDIHLYLVGDGPDKHNLVSNKKYKDLDNLTFIEPVSRDVIRDIYCSVDCAFVPLKDLEVFKTVFPSKTFELWSYGLPTIVGVGGEIDKIISKYDCAISVLPDDVDSYFSSVIKIYESVDLSYYRDKAYHVSKNHFSYDICNPMFEKVIMRCFND